MENRCGSYPRKNTASSDIERSETLIAVGTEAGNVLMFNLLGLLVYTVDVGSPVLSVEWSDDASVSQISSGGFSVPPAAATTENHAQQIPKSGLYATRKVSVSGFIPVPPPRNPTRFTRKLREAPQILPLQAPRKIEKVTPKRVSPSKPHSDASIPFVSTGLQPRLSSPSNGLEIKDNRRRPQPHEPGRLASSEEACVSICSPAEASKTAVSPRSTGSTLGSSGSRDVSQQKRDPLLETPARSASKRPRLSRDDSSAIADSSRKCEDPQMMLHEMRGLSQHMTGIPVKSHSQPASEKRDLEGFDASSDFTAGSPSRKFDGRISHMKLVHSRQCVQGKCSAVSQGSDIRSSSRGCEFESPGEGCRVIRCDFMAFDQHKMHRLQKDTSLLKRVVEDLREEFWALRNVLLESETKRRWKDLASSSAV
jgi:hypothetical protein